MVPSSAVSKMSREWILDFYDSYSYYPDNAEFRLTTKSPFIKIDALRALLHHAVAPNSVALELWKILQAYLGDDVELQGNPQSLIPHCSPRR